MTLAIFMFGPSIWSRVRLAIFMFGPKSSSWVWLAKVRERVKREGESWWNFEVSPVTWKASIITCIAFDQRPFTIGILAASLSRVRKRLKPRHLTNCRISRQDRDVTHFNIPYILVRADKKVQKVGARREKSWQRLSTGNAYGYWYAVKNRA